MAKATYWQRGESLDYRNKTDSVIEANVIIDLGTRIGITGTHINPGEIGSLHVCGIYEMPKAAGVAIILGEAVYFDGTEISTTDTGTPAGYAAADASATATTILVKLLG